MSKKSKTWNLRIINSANFIAFLKKFKLVSKSVPLELEGGNLFGKVKTEDKSVIKYVNIDVDNVFEGELPTSRLKIGILEISRLIDVFKYFGPEEELNVSIDSEPYEDEYIATKIRFYTPSTDIFVKCSDISLLSYIDDNIQKMIHSTEGSEVNFQISKEMFQKLSSLTGIDSNPEELLNFDVQEEEIRVRGNSFQCQILKGQKVNGYTKSSVYTIYKKQFPYIDPEDSEIYFHENRILVKSLESDSYIAIGLVEI